MTQKRNEIVSKHKAIQEYSHRKTNLEYKKLSTPKTWYTLEYADGSMYSVSRREYEAADVPETKAVAG